MRQLRPLDVLAIILAIGVVTAVSVQAASGGIQGSQVQVESEEGTFVYALSQQVQASVEGPIGHTHFEVVDGRVRVTESPCRDQICVAGGWIGRTGEWVACLPNRVFVRVVAGDDAPFDAQTF